MQSNEILLSLVGNNFKRFARDEWHGPCFKCGGNHRFIVFGDGKAWCRQCQWKGDAIQLLIDRDGMSFADAAAQVRSATRVCCTCVCAILELTLVFGQSHHSDRCLLADAS